MEVPLREEVSPCHRDVVEGGGHHVSHSGRLAVALRPQEDLSRECHPTTEPPSVNPAAGSGSNGPAFSAAKPRPGVLAQRRAVVAAPLEDDQAAADRGDPAAHLVVDVGREREIADRVQPVGIEAERHDDH